MQSSSEDVTEDLRELDRAEELLVDVLRLAGQTASTLSRALIGGEAAPEASSPASTASAATVSGSEQARQALAEAKEYLACVRELQDILTRQSRHVTREKILGEGSGGAVSGDTSTATYTSVLDARLAATDVAFSSSSDTVAGKEDKKDTKKRKRG